MAWNQRALKMGFNIWFGYVPRVLDSLKKFLTIPLFLVAPMDNEPLLLYIVVVTQVVNTTIVLKGKGRRTQVLLVQHSIYFISFMQIEIKTQYPQIQKLLYVVTYFPLEETSIIRMPPVE